MQVTAERPRGSAGTALPWQLLLVAFAQVFLPCWEEAVRGDQGTAAHSCSLAGTRQGGGEALGSPGWAAHAGKCPAGTGCQVPALLLGLPSAQRVLGAVGQEEMLQFVSVFPRCQLYLLGFTHQ